jgi:hypothetical protein
MMQFLILLFVGMSWSLSEVCGVIDRPTSFMRSGSPYYVKGDLVVLPEGRLTIDSGVEVIIASKDQCPKIDTTENGTQFTLNQYDYTDSLFVSIKVKGSFFINGNSKDPVIIRPEDTTNTYKPHWDGIRIYNGDPQITHVQYLHISGANKAFEVTRSRFSIANSIIENNNSGIHLLTNGNLDIFNNIMTKNFNAGIVIDNAAPNIYSNIFFKNYAYGIWSDKKAAARIKFNNFWDNGEFNCYRCPWQLEKVMKINHNGDSTDAEMNLFLDPLFVGSDAAKLLEFKDLDLKTPASQVLDSHILDLEAQARKENQELGIPKSKRFIPRGPSLKARFLLSKYSPLSHAGPENFFFNNEDGSRGDLGVHGASVDLVKQQFPFK